MSSERPTTWTERRQQLQANRQHYCWRYSEREPCWCCPPRGRIMYPFLLGLWDLREGPLLVRAARQTGAPIAVSEEGYPDVPDKVVLYRTRPGDLSDWWQAVETLRAEAGTEEG